MSYPQQPPTPSGPGDPSPGGSRRRTTVLVVVLAVVGVLVVALAGVAIASAGGDEGGSATAVAGGPASSTAAPTPTESETTTPEPTPTETETESDDPAPAPSGGKLKAAEYTKDWDFKLGDVALQAEHKAGWDYATCAPVAKGGKLKTLGCTYAVEVTYTALGGKLQFTNLYLALPSENAANAVGEQGQDQLTRTSRSATRASCPATRSASTATTRAAPGSWSRSRPRRPGSARSSSTTT